MKRQQDRDCSPSNKMSRSSLSRFEESPRDRLTPERDRREGRGNKSPSHRGSFAQRQHGGKSRGGDSVSERSLGRNNPHESASREVRDDFVRNSSRSFDNKSSSSSVQYKVLRVSNINHKVADGVVKDVLIREFKKYGDASVKVIHESNERVAYIYFRNPDDAREARHNKNRAVVFDKPVNVDPIYTDSGGGSDRRGRKSFSPPDNGVNPFPRPRGASPTPSNSSSTGASRRGRHNSLDTIPPLPRDAQYRREGPGSHHEMHHIHREEKKEKFPNYLHHIPPEEDDKATRTLFVGNLEVTIQESDLRRIFEHYGVVEDIDVKRPPPGQGNAYAFIKFLNLDMAHRAKVEMSGQYIGKFQCKIGYGKATPTTRIWVGGLGPWTSLSHLEREFDRFGAIKKIDFVKGDNHAYILYDSIDAAQAACQEMRGFPLGGPERRLRVDFADTTPYNYRQPSPRNNFREDTGERYVHQRRFEHEHLNQRNDFYSGQEQEYGQWHTNSSNYVNQQYDSYYDRNQRQPRNDWSNFGERNERHPNNSEFRNWNRDRQTVWRDDVTREWPERRKRPRSPEGTRDNQRLDRSKESNFKHIRVSRTPDCLLGDHDRTTNVRGRLSPGPFHDPSHRESREYDSASGVLVPKDRRYSFSSERSMDVEKLERDRTRRDEYRDDRARGNVSGPHGESRNGFTTIHNATSLQDISRSFSVAWHGGLVLKNSAFPIRMYNCEGDIALVENMMKDSTKETPMLRITQRLRLDQPKLDDVSKRITNSGHLGHCILVGMSGSVQMSEDVGNAIQQRPLRNLVTYLKQKEAAGVIALPVNRDSQDSKEMGVLYAFPPCPFSHDLIKRVAPNLTEEGLKDDHLVVVVVKGAI